MRRLARITVALLALVTLSSLGSWVAMERTIDSAGLAEIAMMAAPTSAEALPPAPHTQCIIWGNNVEQNAYEFYYGVLGCEDMPGAGGMIPGATNSGSTGPYLDCINLADTWAEWVEYQFVQDCLAGDSTCSPGGGHPFC